MKSRKKYLVAVALLAVLAVVFGLAETVVLVSESVPPQQLSYSEDSMTHYMNPPTYDSGWVDIRNKPGQHFTLTHGLNTTEVFVDITGKQSLDPMGGALSWSRTHGGANNDFASSVVQTSDGGYVLPGYTQSFGAGGADFWLVKTNSAGIMEWNQTYGGPSTDYGQSVVQTFDGGYALAGQTWSFGAGDWDIWLVKTDAAGNMQWSQTYGGANADQGGCVVQTDDGGYAIAGHTQSFGAGGADLWLIKTNSTGHMLWNQTYGGPSADYVQSMVLTSDGGYAIAGNTESFGAGSWDMWLVKTNSTGNALWNQTYGGASNDMAYSVVQTFDGGYILTGRTESFGAGGNDFWLVKTDASGMVLWNQTYGGANNDYGRSLVQDGNGGYAIAGYTNSYGAGLYDLWLVKTDASGMVLWNQTYGGANNDYGGPMVQTSEGGYALAGYTNSYGAGLYDLWLVKVHVEVNLEHQRNLNDIDYTTGWSKTYGGVSEDRAWSVIQTSDGGYALAGVTLSYGAGNGDFWLVKTDDAGNMQWSQTYGGADYDIAYSVVQTDDGGYAIAGYTWSFGAGGYDFWLVKTDDAGNMQWSQTYGGADFDRAYSVIQTTDGGYAIAGDTDLGLAGGIDFWLVKTDDAGNMQWSQTYGGANIDRAWSVIQTSDGGYALAGRTDSFGGGGGDFWLVKTDDAGITQWSQTYGGASTERAYSLVQSVDGGYALAGYTAAFFATSEFEFWLVKTNSSGSMLWNQTYGGKSRDIAYSMVQTSDGGYALAGYTESFGAGGYDFLLVKTDDAGNFVLSQTYGGTNNEEARSIVQSNDGGYAIAGDTNSFGAGSWDFWLAKTDIETGLTWTGLTNYTIILYRGRTDPYWNFVRVRIWAIKEPTWQYGDITGPEGVPDGVVDGYDLTLACGNYGKTYDDG